MRTIIFNVSVIFAILASTHACTCHQAQVKTETIVEPVVHLCLPKPKTVSRGDTIKSYRFIATKEELRNWLSQLPPTNNNIDAVVFHKNLLKELAGDNYISHFGFNGPYNINATPDNNYAFLSNFYEWHHDDKKARRSLFQINGVNFYNSEATVQLTKFRDLNEMKSTDALTMEYALKDPDQARKAPFTTKAPKKRAFIFNDLMTQVLRAKFAVPELKQKLLSTKDAILVEGTTPWNDQNWGMIEENDCFYGENKLGRTLMHVRKELNAKP